MEGFWEIITWIPRLGLWIITLPLRLFGIDLDIGMDLW